VTTYNYDDAGRLSTLVNALSQTWTYGYDAADRRVTAIDNFLDTWHYAFDVRNRLTTTTYPTSTTTVYTYDGVGHKLTTTDPAGKVTTNAYDDAGQLLSVTDALSHVTVYGYDLSGNLTGITDANNHTTSFQYDSLNRRILHSLPLSQSETKAYDAAGNVSAQTDFNGKTTTFTYDTLNRLLSKIPDASLSQPTVTFTYTPTGKRATMVDASGTTTYSYDNRDRVASKATPEGTLSYTYDAHSNVLTLASSNTNGASATYTYNVMNQLATVVDNRLLAQGATSGTTSYGYNAVDILANYTAPNGVQTNYHYDAQYRLTQINSVKTSTFSTFNYTVGAAGNRTVVGEQSGRTVNYGYDDVYKLTSEAVTADPGSHNGTVNYSSYDPVGNRLTMTSTLSGVPAGSFSYDNDDRLGGDTYDANGNTISSVGIANTYDFENHMLSHGAVTMVYDGDGNRVAETVGGTTTKYLVDALNPTGYPQVMDELVSGAVTRTYTYGLQRIGENQKIGTTQTASFYGYDGHGNVRFLTGAAGTVTDTYVYDAFGLPLTSTGTTPNNFLYSGEQFDSALGMYYLRARYYNPATGRFLTMDTDQGTISDPGTLNKYDFAQNNPVNLLDPTGHGVLDEAILIGEVLVRYTIPRLAVGIGTAACPAIVVVAKYILPTAEAGAQAFDFELGIPEFAKELLDTAKEFCESFFPE
jgi:RHS repeat-associated protein